MEKYGFPLFYGVFAVFHNFFAGKFFTVKDTLCNKHFTVCITYKVPSFFRRTDDRFFVQTSVFLKGERQMHNKKPLRFSTVALLLLFVLVMLFLSRREQNKMQVGGIQPYCVQDGLPVSIYFVISDDRWSPLR
jgi:hypothetical protein